jgi:type IV pilus assembly protein PilV
MSIHSSSNIRPARRARGSFASPNAQRGVGMIEVLVAVLILAIGLLGVAALQATALRNSQSAMERSQGVVHAYAVFDSMRASVPAITTSG